MRGVHLSLQTMDQGHLRIRALHEGPEHVGVVTKIIHGKPGDDDNSFKGFRRALKTCRCEGGSQGARGASHR